MVQLWQIWLKQEVIITIEVLLDYKNIFIKSNYKNKYIFKKNLCNFFVIGFLLWIIIWIKNGFFVVFQIQISLKFLK